MLLPAMQHGVWKDVRKRVSAAVRRIVRGESFVDVVSEDGMIDTNETTGFIVVKGSLPKGAPPAIYCGEPWKGLHEAISELDDRAGLEIEEVVFRESLSVTWGVLGLMSPGNTLWFAGHPEWESPFMRAALAAWNEIDQVGERYYQAIHPERMWALPNSLKHVLARAGVPPDRLREPLPKGGPAALLKYAKIAT